ncbi:MAG: DNA-3-methyladenine glycosylase I [Leptolyngbyaceae cyanobacterium HOT.MB2.61]|nr:DNA-3-methyladenine glycosylase I [Leptolyngbyaceae cyanobacterium HOT.MB2.61]
MNFAAVPGSKMSRFTSSITMNITIASGEFPFTTIGSTICYAFMQACGLVHDHTIDCFCYRKNQDRAVSC